MSAILPAPALPTLFKLEDLKAYIESTVQNTIQTTLEPMIERIVKRLLAEQTPVENIVETVLATSELKVLKRISTLETVLGFNDLDLDDEQKTIPERIEALEKKAIIAPLEKPREETKQELPIIPHTTLDMKACEVVEHLKYDVEERHGSIFMNSMEFYDFMKNTITENLRMKDIKNPRQAKKDIIKRILELYSDIVVLIKNKSGNKVTGIALKTS
jgi:hypothetical protein